MTTTESITISAATIDQLLSIREIAAQNNEDKQTEESAAILRTLESTMKLIGIKWEQEEQEEPKAEDKQKGLTYRVHYLGSKSGKMANFTFKTDRSFRTYSRSDCNNGIGLGKPFENDMFAAAQRIMARPDSKMNVHGFNYMRIRRIECVETGETKLFTA